MSGKLSFTYVGTSDGVYSVAVPDGTSCRLALQGVEINYLFCKKQTLLVAVGGKRVGEHEEPLTADLLDLLSVGSPLASGDVMSPRGASSSPRFPAGLYALDLARLDSDPEPVLLWEGNCRCCCALTMPDGRERVFIGGGDPCQILISDDDGQTWRSNTNFEEAMKRQEQFIPPHWLEQHGPRVLSLDFAACGRDGGPAVVATVSLGGVFMSLDDGETWEERNNNLGLHTFSVRPDPFRPTTLFATTGSIPPVKGGLHVSPQCGQHWEVLTHLDGVDVSLYSVGLALNPYRQGELLLTAALPRFSPQQALVFHGNHHEGGTTQAPDFANISEKVFEPKRLSRRSTGPAGFFSPLAHFASPVPGLRSWPAEPPAGTPVPMDLTDGLKSINELLSTGLSNTSSPAPTPHIPSVLSPDTPDEPPRRPTSHPPIGLPPSGLRSQPPSGPASPHHPAHHGPHPRSFTCPPFPAAELPPHDPTNTGSHAGGSLPMSPLRPHRGIVPPPNGPHGQGGSAPPSPLRGSGASMWAGALQQKHEPNHTPVPFFVQQGALLGLHDGRLLFCEHPATGTWRCLSRLPSAITTMASDDDISSPSSVQGGGSCCGSVGSATPC